MDTRQQAHDAFGRRDWQAAYDLFRATTELDANDYDAFAESAHWLGQAEAVIASYTEAYRLHLEGGEAGRAAYSGFMVAVYLRLRGESSQADGWQSRSLRLLADETEGPEHGYPLYLEIARLMGSDLDAATESAKTMQALGRQFGDDTLVALGVFFEGRVLVKQAHVREGLALLDEAMLAALSDNLKPLWTGAIYCGLIAACHELVDIRRAREWTEAARQWCAPLPVASLYPGICRVHGAQLLALCGAWEQAEADALSACEDMAPVDVFAVADGFYEVGEIRRRRGDLAGAEEAYGRAREIGRDPQPGYAMLRLAQGRPEAASSSIGAALAGFTGSPLERGPLLEAQVHIALAADDAALAAGSATELDDIAETFDSPGLRAASCVCRASVALATDVPVAALGLLRLALSFWQELDAPYECARTRLLLAKAYSALDDVDGASRETALARACFERLGAAADLQELDGVPTAVSGLSPREVQVLRLVATGLSNREIALELVLSEKTVARHVSNIFTKLDVSSRSAATAYAFSHHLVTSP